MIARRQFMKVSRGTVLDVCCGSRMFWFNRKDPRAVYCDNRRETHVLMDKSSKGGNRTLVIDPDYLADFTALPSRKLRTDKAARVEA